MDTYSIIRGAIVNKLQVLATYKGLPREMCPHAIGTKKGKAHALFYQFAGESSSALPPEGGWRCLSIDELINVSTMKGAWHTSPNYSVERQKCIDDIDAAVN